MANVWFITEHLVEDHRAALEAAARQAGIKLAAPAADRRVEMQDEAHLNSVLAEAVRLGASDVHLIDGPAASATKLVLPVASAAASFVQPESKAAALAQPVAVAARRLLVGCGVEHRRPAAVHCGCALLEG